MWLKELKQDISSFRYEVLGLLKGNKLPGVQSSSFGAASKISDQNEVFKNEDRPAECTTISKKITCTNEPKNKLSFFELTSLVCPKTMSKVSDSPASCKTLSNGTTPKTTDISKEKQNSKSIVKDSIKNLSFFRKRTKPYNAELNCNKIYTVSEEITHEENVLKSGGSSSNEGVRNLEPTLVGSTDSDAKDSNTSQTGEKINVFLHRQSPDGTTSAHLLNITEDTLAKESGKEDTVNQWSVTQGDD